LRLIVAYRWVQQGGHTAALLSHRVTSTAVMPAAVPASDTQFVGAGEFADAPVIVDGTLELAPGAVVNGPITFAPGGTGTLYDHDQAALADTVVGFTEGANHLSFSGQDQATEAAVVASAVVQNGNTILNFPDHTSIVLAGVTHIDAGIFA
jgi:hypothetical protein